MTVQMTLTKTPAWVLEAGNLRFTFHPSGDLFEALGSGFMLNQVLSSPAEGSMNNLYLRLFGEQGVTVHPLIGLQSRSEVARSGNRIIWKGEAEGVRYEVSFVLSSKGAWFWDVQLLGGGAFAAADIVYGQDVGLASSGAVRSNEAYLSQYIDQAVYADADKGWIVCSRQNQPQDGKFPYLQQGCLTGAEAYSTDGYQFFGLSYKDTHRPEALERASLPSEVYQYEFAYTALQSRKINVAEGGRVVFYGFFQDNHPQAVTEAEFASLIAAAWDEVQPELNEAPVDAFSPVPARSTDLGVPVYSQSLSQEEVDKRYPDRLQEEWENGELLSFFTPTYEHVVLKAKELRTERPHGHILMSGAPDRAGAEVLTTTAYMYGVFHSQLVVGNTSFNKLLSNTRNALNALKTSGQRIYAEVGGQYRMLAMPSLFELGFNYATWIYVFEDDVLRITAYTSNDAPEAVLELVSEKQIARKYLITTQITMSDREFEVPYEHVSAGNVFVFQAAEGTPPAQTYPKLRYRMTLTGAEAALYDERRLVPDLQVGIAPLHVLETTAASAWQLRIEGGLKGLADGNDRPVQSFEEAVSKYREGMAARMNGFALSHQEEKPAVTRLNILSWWYTHNMRVHFAVPHGLEQYGGAAWGTRDVCQGPAEYFLAVQHYDAVRDIIHTVYSHQYEDNGAWPQWFMFDEYYRVQQDESHGDIIVWPLKLIGDYIAATGDMAILLRELPYTKRHANDFTTEKFTLLSHIEKQMDYIRSHFLHDTHLSSYGDGDWDDTLQPASAALRTYMVSSWTVALTYQAMMQFGKLLVEKSADVRQRSFGAVAVATAELIRADFGTYMQPDEIIPGFLYLEEPDRPEKLLHPDDTRTGIQYRLLPMTRSMIAELLTPEQAQQHYELIKRELQFPDGVRLMNRPAAYEGGVSTRFKRAEQAANFGREIGLQYVHAHIRFIEAMAKLGHSDEAWHALQVINPVGLREVVPNAELRQSNAYFSSSDGKFATRYEAAQRFEELRSGAAPVKGGWRIYSSGPGIYMNQLISNVLGIRHEADALLLDPVLPEELDGLTLQYAIGGRPVRIRYQLAGSAIRRVTLNGSEIEFDRLLNAYRATGARIAHAALDAHWSNDASVWNEMIVEA